MRAVLEAQGRAILTRMRPALSGAESSLLADLLDEFIDTAVARGSDIGVEVASVGVLRQLLRDELAPFMQLCAQSQISRPDMVSVGDTGVGKTHRRQR